MRGTFLSSIYFNLRLKLKLSCQFDIVVVNFCHILTTNFKPIVTKYELTVCDACFHMTYRYYINTKSILY